ncbi:MAG: hypothetical protein ACR5LD_11590 [Symbiopectobacterium sp.]
MVSILGQNTLILMQSWITKIFGTMTMIVVAYIYVQHHIGCDTDTAVWQLADWFSHGRIRDCDGTGVVGHRWSGLQLHQSPTITHGSVFFLPWSAARHYRSSL